MGMNRAMKKNAIINCVKRYHKYWACATNTVRAQVFLVAENLTLLCLFLVIYQLRCISSITEVDMQRDRGGPGY